MSLTKQRIKLNFEEKSYIKIYEWTGSIGKLQIYTIHTPSKFEAHSMLTRYRTVRFGARYSFGHSCKTLFPLYFIRTSVYYIWMYSKIRTFTSLYVCYEKSTRRWVECKIHILYLNHHVFKFISTFFHVAKYNLFHTPINFKHARKWKVHGIFNEKKNTRRQRQRRQQQTNIRNTGKPTFTAGFWIK